MPDAQAQSGRDADDIIEQVCEETHLGNEFDIVFRQNQRQDPQDQNRHIRSFVLRVELGEELRHGAFAGHGEQVARRYGYAGIQRREVAAEGDAGGQQSHWDPQDARSLHANSKRCVGRCDHAYFVGGNDADEAKREEQRM